MAKSKEELISMIENDLVDPSTNKITGERVKNALTEMADAMGTGSGNMEYWSLDGKSVEDLAEVGELLIFSPIMKCVSNSDILIVPSYYFIADNSVTLTAFGWMGNMKTNLFGELMTLDEYFASYGVSFEALGLVKISEEEFYTI